MRAWASAEPRCADLEESYEWGAGRRMRRRLADTARLSASSLAHPALRTSMCLAQAYLNVEAVKGVTRDITGEDANQARLTCGRLA